MRTSVRAMDKDVLSEWLAAGDSLEEIGRRVARHPSTVGYWVKRHGLAAPGRDRHAPRGGISFDELQSLIDRGLTVRGIAAELDVSVGTVRHWLRRHGLRTERARRPREHAVGQRMSATCVRHGDTEFIIRGDGSPRCLACRSEAVVAHRRRLKETLIREAGGVCVLCAYDRCAGALHFHHLDPSDKVFSIAQEGMTRALDVARSEAAKCVLLCANCHAEVENGYATIPATISTRRLGVSEVARSGVAQLADASGC